MARTSKRTHASSSAKNAASGAGQGKIQGARYYKAGIYARLSSDQGSKACGQALKNESVETQVEIAKNYVADWNRHHGDKIEIVGQYADLGKTGTNFDREDFKRLMQDVRLGDIDCVIVKDDCVIKARTPQTLENRHFLRIGTEFRAIQRPQRAAYHIETS